MCFLQFVTSVVIGVAVKYHKPSKCSFLSLFWNLTVSSPIPRDVLGYIYAFCIRHERFCSGGLRIASSVMDLSCAASASASSVNLPAAWLSGVGTRTHPVFESFSEIIWITPNYYKVLIHILIKAILKEKYWLWSFQVFLKSIHR